ncbi:MAG TPA: hypothetical protein VFB45_21645 [Pseudolabrys sp.]|nr:hypothetical protein [Pseudolabrys sp.]
MTQQTRHESDNATSVAAIFGSVVAVFVIAGAIVYINSGGSHIVALNGSETTGAGGGVPPRIPTVIDRTVRMPGAPSTTVPTLGSSSGK